ncbi:MAG: flavin-nucleotide-binding protein [Gammaproteobacteria bacterium]|jgi:hypothetical protein|nr:flavin-nucleotide-binding protein [Gammaproteobacteria bacterium]|tara:strand:+ start:462 stop:932 length:471 start_codon:yes stop_codon:yes gene_type:complete
MAQISSDIREFVSAQRLGFLATVCPNGTPNLSPKGLTFVLDENHLAIGEVRSPQSVKNLRSNPAAEVNVVDVIARKGFRFKGSCTVHESGSEFERLLGFLRGQGAQSTIHSIIVLEVEFVETITSPAYDSEASETDVKMKWKDRQDQQHKDLESDA